MRLILYLTVFLLGLSYGRIQKRHMRLILYLTVFLLGLSYGRIQKNQRVYKRRAPSAFQLARLQRDYDDYDSGDSAGGKGRGDPSF
ncbi:unnamed protein product [Strongylus vulgaris]|uniref:Uncharacterized protein n=1 Tax=Strongylus vulgaris TaxID=40348 RepID=A0A3P7K5W0_STRVU|nr:unnamed protein product [Strongylus vulgaris]